MVADKNLLNPEEPIPNGKHQSDSIGNMEGKSVFLCLGSHLRQDSHR